jgi:hypothetical protein
VLRDSGEDVNRQPVRLWEVHGGSQPIQFRDDEGRAMEAPEESLGELRAVVALAALDLHDLSGETPVAPVQVGAHRLLLGL